MGYRERLAKNIVGYWDGNVLTEEKESTSNEVEIIIPSKTNEKVQDEMTKNNKRKGNRDKKEKLNVIGEKKDNKDKKRKVVIN